MSEIRLSTKATPLENAFAAVKAFGEPLTTLHDDAPANLIGYELPRLWLPSGRVTASDGLIMEGEPFTRRFNPGYYPLQLIIADLNGDERIAFATLSLSTEPVARWEMAVTEGQDVTTLDPDHIFGYPVDSGTGSFCDPSAQELINQANEPDMLFFNRVTAEMQKVYKHTRDWVHLETERGSAAVFSSGVGDGVYASYFGLNENDAPVVLITDFGLVNWPQRP